MSEIDSEVTTSETSDVDGTIRDVNEIDTGPDVSEVEMDEDFSNEIDDYCASCEEGGEEQFVENDVNENNEVEESETKTENLGEEKQQIENVEDESEQIKCINEKLEGQTHPVTGVPFERQQIEVDGKKCEVVVPQFESKYDAQIPEDMYKSTDYIQFQECNSQLKDEITTNVELRGKFNDEQLEQIEDQETPEGYTWHHDAEAGKIQLVETEIHEKTAHTAGRFIWGGGTDCR